MENYPFTLGYIESTFHTTFLESPEAVSRSCPAGKVHLNVHQFRAHYEILLYARTMEAG